MIYFNPHSPKGVTDDPQQELDRLKFQPTLPEGSDLNFLPPFFMTSRFQPTLPEGSDQAAGNIGKLFEQFQPTLPEGSDSAVAVAYDRISISTHTPRRE